ncbi:serine-rich coiled-coil domain-containing protein 1 [Perognathus longimembris pacificus]|uniref:serine-rich coiled-coil domain-containing protein 1 n=1 Tax=Perognathus longimembris pacificus TaxID=214514 RepID=UPI002018FD69|nr:serine-rich coiled-coil domain-containing protein 1 [Perognathus longimembris pacificus]
MGDSGSRRSTLVSRLPIFRKSISRRHDSLPSSPSSGTPAGAHSSSPSSTHSSSGSTGKRRSLFRTPSISFHHKKASGPKPAPAAAAAPTPGLAVTSNGAAPPPAPGPLQTLSCCEDPTKGRGSRGAGGAGSSRHKKISRSLTEDFDRDKEPSSNKNVFINCLSAGKSEGEDSGFTEEHPPRPAKQPTRKLLPKSFSSHYKFSKPGAQHPPLALAPRSDFSLEIAQPQEPGPGWARAPGSSPASPLLSADPTTAQTPSEFCTFTEDSVSEADAFPQSGSGAAHGDQGAPQDSTSPLSSSPAAAAAAAPRTDVALQDAGPWAAPSPGKLRLEEEGRGGPDPQPSPDTCAAAMAKEALLMQKGGRSESPPPAQGHREAKAVVQNGEPLLRTSSPKPLGWCEPQKGTAEPGGRSHPVSDSKVIPASRDQPARNRTPSGNEAHPSKALASSLSPHREGRFMERRLRSSSEGTAGGSRMIVKPKDGKAEEASSLRKQRASSSSSKMNSLDVLNNLGSCELDEDDLMLDLEFLEEQNLHPSVCQEDSYHSVLMSCAAVGLTPMEPMTEVMKREEPKLPEPSKQSLSLKLTKDVDQELRCSHMGRIPSSPSVDRPVPSVEENGGIDSLPFRLMLQDCTAVKTLLLKMKRVLQESAELSPASSMMSLPVSPLTEEPVPFKDIMKDECSVLKLQLKERDELISQLQEELEKVQHLQKAFASRVDKSTQTELLGCDGLNLKRLEAVQGGREATYRNRTVSQSLNTKDRKAAHTPTEDRFRYPTTEQPSPCKTACQLSSLYFSNFLKEKELAEVIKHSRGTYETLPAEVTQNVRATLGQSSNSLKPAAKPEGFSTFSEKPKDQAPLVPQHSTFTGRFGQPPRGPISLHMYSRKNVFLHHSLHSTELQTLGQQDG